MCEDNQTHVTEIRLLGFQGLNKLKPLFFIGVFLCYMLILCGNLVIITLVATVDYLKIPMFVFLKHLASIDVLLTTTVVPLMLHSILNEEETLTFVGCIIQLYLFAVFGCVQCFLIATMSYDRYLAICAPLRYASLMNPQVCFQLVTGSWVFGILLITSELIAVCQFTFCGLNFVDHFFCDFGPLVELSNSDKSSFTIQDFVLSLFMIPFPFAFIVTTYVCISFNILKIASAYGRRKAFSTCSSHLVTVGTSYGTMITVYVLPSQYNSVNINKYRSLLYIVVSPLMNPIIYSLRNQNIQKALLKLLSNIETFS
ncbi:olfactory receptor 5P81-like [Hyperolius riggenbachi]|uniref:olfactory receptor 5P81-like n=1 Tax=Hyperolius riggenbachi TaxID=752182 RepID=UPI0035A3ACDF